jgi:hypothetical protein
VGAELARDSVLTFNKDAEFQIAIASKLSSYRVARLRSFDLQLPAKRPIHTCYPFLLALKNNNLPANRRSRNTTFLEEFDE